MTAPTEWLQVKAWAVDQLEQARTELESSLLDEVRTALVRGRIKALRDLIAIGEPLPARSQQRRTGINLTAGPTGY